MPKQDWKASGGQARGPAKARWATEPRERWRTFTRLSLPVMILLVALATLFAVLQWLTPPVSPTLFVLSTQNISTTLPPNDPATGDAIALRSLTGVFEVAKSKATDLTRKQMFIALKEIEQSDPKPPLLTPWKPTELIVYVNMVGVRWEPAQSDRVKSHAWLVAEGFDPDRDFGAQLVSVRQLFESVAHSKATRKLVILDCQRAAVNPHFGLATEQFVEAVQADLNEMSPDIVSKFSVLYSCGAGEVAWPMRDSASTAFGHFFVQGVEGAADDPLPVAAGATQSRAADSPPPAAEGATQSNAADVAQRDGDAAATQSGDQADATQSEAADVAQRDGKAAATQSGDQTDAPQPEAADVTQSGGNNDRRVTLDELEKYLVREVAGWTLRNCDAVQTPFLDDSTDSIDAKEFTLAVLGEQTTHVATGAPARSASELTSMYQQVYSVAYRPAPPGDWTPAKWAQIHHDLLAAERYYRAGNVDEAKVKMGQVNVLLDKVSLTHKSLRDRIDELSPTSRQFLAHCCAPGWPELPPAGTAPGETVVLQVVEGSLLPADADKRLDDIVRDNTDLLPAAAQWTRLSTARSRSGVELDASVLTDVIALRQSAETAARPAHPLASAWMRRSLAAADVARRDAEDHLLLQGGSSLEMGSPSAATGSARAKYEEATIIKETVTNGYRLRDRLLTELPYWIAYVGRAASYVTAEQPQVSEKPSAESAARPEGISFPATARRGVGVLLTELKALHLALLVNPEDSTVDNMSAALEQIRQSSVTIELHLTRMEQELVKYATSLADSRLSVDSGATWRRIDDLLVLPFAMVDETADPAVDSQNAAELRAKLMERTLAEYTPDDADRPEASSRGPVEESQEAAAMYVRLYSLPWDISPGEEAPAEIVTAAGIVSGRVYKWLVDKVVDGCLPDLDQETLQRADVAFRLLQHGLGEDLTVESPAIRLRIAALRDCLASQAQRMSEDFYAATDQSRPPYFARVSTELLEDARRLSDVNRFLQPAAPASAETTEAQIADTTSTAGTSQISQVGQEVQRLLTVLDSAQLTPKPVELTFRGEAGEELSVGMSNAAQFPLGTAAVDVGGATSAGGAGGNVSFLVSRPTDGSDHTFASVYFRGHEFARDVPLAIVSEFAGPAITYRRQNSGDGRIRFRATRVEQEPINLLFVLDCSGSMGLPDSSGESRIDGLRRALTQFVEAVDGSNVRIGVRLFGRRIENIDLPEARTDTELAMPIGRLGVGTLDGMRDLLIAKGHSPMFRAMIDAVGDFGNAGAGRSVVVLISDGADNWALAGEKPGFDELLGAYQGKRIQINTVGFEADKNADFAMLRQIATAGDVEGLCLAVENANDVLQEMAGLVGLPGYRILRDGDVVREESQFSSPGQSIDLPPGQYDVEILGTAGDVLTKRSVRLLPSDEHIFVYDSGTLRYATSPAQSARAVKVGGPDQPDLLVFDAQNVGDEFVVEFGLEQKLGNAADLSPVSVRITALADADPQREWVFKHLTPNVADQHFPRWRVSMSDWPGNANQVQVDVVWNDLPEERIPISLDWDQEFRVKAAADHVELVRRDREQVDLDGVSQTAVLLTFALTESNANIEDWAVSTTLPVVDVRQSYSRQHGMYTVQLIVSPNTELNEVTLFRTAPAPAGRTLRALAPILDKRINP